MNIDDLALSIRSNHALKEAGITTVEQLISLDFREVNKIKNIGDKSVSEIVWTCMLLHSEPMKQFLIEWNDVRPDDWQEIREKARRFDEVFEKARRFDEIAKIVTG
jgi:hypothetical protein